MLLLLLVATAIYAQSYTIRGKVTDAQGNALMGVSISIKNTQIGTVSDTVGKYVLTVADGKPHAFEYRYIGYQTVTKKLSAAKDAELNIALAPDIANLNITTVTGSKYEKQLVEETVTVTNKKNGADLAKGVDKVPGVNIASGRTKARGKATSTAQGGTSAYTYSWSSGSKVGYAAPNVVTGNYTVTVTDGNGISRSQDEYNTEEYASLVENEFKNVKESPVSTFSSDVDKASYSNIRRFIMQGNMPPQDAVRVEEMINYFKYDYPEPKDKHPFSITTEVSECPWNKEHRLVHIGLKGKEMITENRPKSNLVFLIDVSGSMNSPERLPLVKSSMRLLVGTLNSDDRVSIVVYAGNAGLVLPPTSGDKKDKIMDAIDRLEAGGSTAGGAGIQLAYNTAREHYIKDGNNRVILATDGDFNVGVSSEGELVRMIEKERESGVFLTALGFGMGNYKDSKMKKLADKGNGNYAYIDNLMEAQKVMVNEGTGTLYTIAKDVKIQVEFNPTLVQSYRLIGYESRMLNREDFNDDKKDAGEVGAGHTVTALYEIVPGTASTSKKTMDTPNSDPLKYQTVEESENAKTSGELLTVKFRYKLPKEDESKLITMPLKDDFVPIAKASDNFRFSAAVAQFGMLIRDSKFKGNANYSSIISLASGAKGNDENGYRNEFVKLVKLAENIQPYKASR